MPGKEGKGYERREEVYVHGGKRALAPVLTLRQPCLLPPSPRNLDFTVVQSLIVPLMALFAQSTATRPRKIPQAKVKLGMGRLKPEASIG